MNDDSCLFVSGVGANRYMSLLLLQMPLAKKGFSVELPIGIVEEAEIAFNLLSF